MSKKGLFIIFEGLDKTGKTTQLNLIKEEFLKNNIENIITSFEPGASPIGSSIRPILLNKNLHLSNITEFFLFISDRLEHSLAIILKEIEKGSIVIVDRFHFSTFSYQVYPAIKKLKNKEYKGKDEYLMLKSLVKMDKIFGNYLFSIIKPDMIFYFYDENKNKNIELEKEDRFESRGETFQKIVIEGYKKSFTYYKNFKNIVYDICFSNGIEKNKDYIFNKIFEIYKKYN